MRRNEELYSHTCIYLSRWWFQRLFTPIPGEMIQFDEHIFQNELKPPTTVVVLCGYNTYTVVYYCMPFQPFGICSMDLEHHGCKIVMSAERIENYDHICYVSGGSGISKQQWLDPWE